MRALEITEGVNASDSDGKWKISFLLPSILFLFLLLSLTSEHPLFFFVVPSRIQTSVPAGPWPDAAEPEPQVPSVSDWQWTSAQPFCPTEICRASSRSEDKYNTRCICLKEEDDALTCTGRETIESIQKGKAKLGRWLGDPCYCQVQADQSDFFATSLAR